MIVILIRTWGLLQYDGSCDFMPASKRTLKAFNALICCERGFSVKDRG
jgi:hypothetical protein